MNQFLVEAGHEAIAVDLPGDDTTAGLQRYTELVVEAIGSRPEVVLVAGSLGGFTAPLVCERVPVRDLVLVNAMIPVPGERARDWWAHTGALEAQEEAARGGGYGPFDLATYFLHDVDAKVAGSDANSRPGRSRRSLLPRRAAAPCRSRTPRRRGRCASRWAPAPTRASAPCGGVSPAADPRRRLLTPTRPRRNPNRSSGGQHSPINAGQPSLRQ